MIAGIFVSCSESSVRLYISFTLCASRTQVRSPRGRVGFAFLSSIYIGGITDQQGKIRWEHRAGRRRVQRPEFRIPHSEFK